MVTPPVQVPGEEVVVRCSEGALKGMLWHARRGLPRKEEGGSIDGDYAIEVKGFLLGQVDLSGGKRIVTVKEIVQLPFNEQDAGDAAYFNAQDRAFLEKRLRSRPSLQLVGNYHSHPNHEIKLSDQDVIYLTQYLPETYHVAAIVGPREPAVGFFLRNEEGTYTPWQEPVSRVLYVKGERKTGAKGEAVESSSFAWRPDIKVVDAGDGTVTYVGPHRGVRKRVVGLLAAAAIVVAAGIIYLATRGNGPIMSVVPAEVALNASGERSKTVELRLDKKGDFNFIVQVEDLPKWLEVSPTKGQLSDDKPGSVTVSANMKELVLDRAEKYTFTVIGAPAKGGTGNSVPVTVSALKDIDVQTETLAWNLPPLRADRGRIRVTLPDKPDGNGVEVTVRGLAMEGAEWVLKWSRLNPSRDFTVAATEFGPIYDWNRVRVEARAVMTSRSPNKMLSEEFVGSVEMGKSRSAWNLNPPTTQAGKVTLVTKPLPADARVVFTANRGGHAESTFVEQKAGETKTHVEQYWDLRTIGATATYIDDRGAHEYHFQHSMAVATTSPPPPPPPATGGSVSADEAYDRTQGPAGKKFRTANANVYASANLNLFGKFGGPRHIQDIPAEKRWGRMPILSGNEKVYDSWGEYVRVGKSARHGEMAWEYDAESKRVKLYFAFEESGYKETLDWLLAQGVVRKTLQEAIDKGGGRLRFDYGPDYGNTRAFPVVAQGQKGES